MTNSMTPRAEPPRPRRFRPTRLVLIGGLAAGTGFAAVTGISAAAGTPSKSTPSTSAHAARLRAPRSVGLGGPMGPGVEGTITAVSGTSGSYTLTLRTLAGTETVTATSSTTVYGPDLQTTTLSSSDVGAVVAVSAKAPSGSSSSGTVAATAIHFADPTVVGRITSVGNGTYTLVGPDGQEITVDTTAGTTYYVTDRSTAGAPTTSTTAPSYAVGDIVFASGTETTTGTQSATSATTTVQAVLMGSAPSGGRGPGGPGGPGGPNGGGGPFGGPGSGPPPQGTNGASSSASAA